MDFHGNAQPGGGYDSRKGMSGSGGGRKKGKAADGEEEDGDEDGTEASNKGTRARQREGRVWCERDDHRGYGSISIMPGWSRRLVKQEWTLDTDRPAIRRNSSPLPPLLSSTAPLPPRPSQPPFDFSKYCVPFPAAAAAAVAAAGCVLRAGCLDGWARGLASCWPPCPRLGWRCKDRSGWVSVLCAAHTHTQRAHIDTHTHTHNSPSRWDPPPSSTGGGGKKTNP